MKIKIHGMASCSIAYGFSGKLLVSLRNPPPLSRQTTRNYLLVVVYPKKLARFKVISYTGHT
ncbi:hypothetical protein NC651_007579 [Populus alba x Populus x berolinensis]|nr:hypothetical protein NC651_007565 [Populus alba x Populus x berolinensis]KAJ6931932.1 hypothetical protein NC651_007579 [Populus alba x Populus x berolinensis]